MTSDLPSLEEAAQEALDAIEDRSIQMSGILADVSHQKLDKATAVAVMRQQAHSIKGLAASVGVNMIKVLAHRFEDYLGNVSGIEGRVLADCQVFVDRISEALDGRLNASPEEIARFCRRLPAKGSFDVEDVEVRDIEVMLVMTEGAATNFVTRELAECGYRIVNVWSTVDALALAAQMRPDLVIVSNFMPELTGIDFACALLAMPSTKGIPIALLTSEKRGHVKLEGLPDQVPILSKSSKFADDVADVFSRLGLL
ncbi:MULTISPECIES: Hpt domain-containing protein [Iodidimonas]|uniref:Response regulatory domain-containing protein n=1 Tax=Iodidimonas nitroreducens TaxID=1236968 RepID=A0A5A7NC54_9PROT|nr:MULTISPECIES: Hpt domain-containing protein [Iodidimonas]GAK33080.1 phosphate regulon transcriptional regulatory protein PhoB [alpha proteobacterium Q-1]GER05507.1 hypothetical protein JCM17846_31890 [Iodidimonas nitroreducens]